MGANSHTVFLNHKTMNQEYQNNIFWNDLSVTPPDDTVKVIDDKGIIAFAIPTIYPWKVGERINGEKYSSKYSSPIIPCEAYWNGGWMVACEGISISIGKIIGWQLISENEK